MYSEEELQILLANEGLEHWTEKILDILNLSNIGEIQSASEDMVKKVLDSTDIAIEKRALKTFFNNLGKQLPVDVIIGNSEMVFRNIDEKATGSSGVQNLTIGSTSGNEEDTAVVELITNPNIAAKKQVMSLRQDIQNWLDGLNQENVELRIPLLVKIRLKHKTSATQWLHDVIYLRDVQRALIWAAGIIRANTISRWRIQQLAEALPQILSPSDTIQAKLFPNLREVIESIEIFYETHFDDPFTIENITNLPEILSHSILNIPDRLKDLRRVQQRLESTIKAQSDKLKSHHYLVCVGVLQLFGFQLNKFMFKELLSESDLHRICYVLKEFFKHFCSINSEKQKQAYIFNIALHDTEQKQITVQYMIENMPGGVAPELSAAFTASHRPRCAFQFQIFQAAVQELLDKGTGQLELYSLQCSLKSQFHFLKPGERETYHSSSCPVDLNVFGGPVERFLDILHLKKYYPQKLALEDVTKLTLDMFEDVNKKPNTLPELPWYFVKHILSLDSDTRENCHIFEGFDSKSDDSSQDDEAESTLKSIHPLDLIYVIFLCADDFLRQELADKMVRCQYAIPFVLPEPEDGQNQSTNLILHWALKSITRNFYHNGKIVNGTMVDVEAPLVTCMSLGNETSWKSRLLNKMLSPQQETFWHQGLTGGACKQRISQGMVEVAWYLPGIHHNKFQYPVTFANVRQTVPHVDGVCSRLHYSSSVTCLFVEDTTEELLSFLKQSNALEKVVVVILHKKEEMKRMKQEAIGLQKTFHLQKYQVIRKVAEDGNFNTVYEKLKHSVEELVKTQQHSSSLSKFMMQAKQYDCVDVDDVRSYYGHMAAESILSEIDQFNANVLGSAKAEVLPCQSDITSRREMAAFEKELCRQRKRRKHITIPQHASDQMDSKWKLQLKQIQNNISDSFKYFLYCLFMLDRSNRKYFLQSLKLGLDERSIDLLQPLYDEYEKCRTADENPERDAKLKSLDEKLMYRSLGIEHFFREMAVMYENIVAMKRHTKSNDLDEIMDLLAEIMTDTLMEGTAIEIMDGDVVNVPVAWLSAVLNKIENRDTSTCFKVSALGAQGSGKSTVLNTAFGLNFPVSSGKCTRGVSMQLVKVDQALKKIFNCDYIAVIDSEGLMSRTKLDNSDFDNELSTFVIGLSDLTLVMFKGEGNEMQDVLPLAIHVFLKMNIKGELHACHFVHQNMGAVDVKTKAATDIEAFVRDLNMKTLTAAKDVDQSDQYTKFTDVLQYSPITDNTYVPGLWNGALPMAKINAHYSQTMQILKQGISKTIVAMNEGKQKRMFTFKDFTRRINELWEAIKYENFVLSFKNVLASEAHKRLAKILTDEQWAIKREIRVMLKEEENVIENEIVGGRQQRSVRQLFNNSQTKVINHIRAKAAELKTKIMHYFQCGGCKECSAEVTNRHLLANNEKEFEDEVTYLERSMIREIETQLETLEFKLKTDKDIQKLSTDLNYILKGKVQEALKTLKSEHLTPNAMEEIFDQLWNEATREILSKNMSHVERDPNIEATVQATVSSLLRNESHLYYMRRTRRNYLRRSQSKFTVDRAQHMKLKRGFPYIKDQDTQRLQNHSDAIIKQTAKYYSSKSPEGKKFNQTDVDLLFKDVLEEIHRIHDERFRITPDYVLDIVCHVEERAVMGFTEMHYKYFSENTPETLLRRKRRGFHDLFIVEMGHGGVAAQFCETVLRYIILKNIDEQLSCTELLHDLRVHCSEIFRDIKSIQASIMIDLFRQNQFKRYAHYITQYETHIKEKLSNESTSYFTKGDRLKHLAKLKNDHLITVLKTALDETVRGHSPDDNFMKSFFSKIDNLKILHDETAAYLDLDIPDIEQFSEMVVQHLEHIVKQDIVQTISFWNVTQKLKEKEFEDFLFTEVIGCKEKCPFCFVPCDAHTGGKTKGNHSATLHRPRGLCGEVRRETNRPISDDCCVAVASDSSFQLKDGSLQSYKEYKKIHPEWAIHGNANPEVEKYWKWVFAKYQADFAKLYCAEVADDIPDEWFKYDIYDIKKDIEDNYHIPLDVSSLTAQPE